MESLKQIKKFNFGHLSFTDVHVHVQVVMQLIINAGGLKIF